MAMSMAEKSDWYMDYVRIRKAEKRDPEKIHRGLQQAYRIEHPERVMGYAGFFFEPGNVYVSGCIAEWMESERFSAFVLDALKRFEKGDWGEVTRSTKDENIENRYAFGIGRLFGRYGTRRGNGEGPYDEVICIRLHDGNTWITGEDEADWFLLLEPDEMKHLPYRTPEQILAEAED